MERVPTSLSAAQSQLTQMKHSEAFCCGHSYLSRVVSRCVSTAKGHARFFRVCQQRKLRWAFTPLASTRASDERLRL